MISRNLNVLFISYDGMTDPLGQSQVIPYLSGLSKRGYKIVLLSCEKPGRYKQYGTKIHALLEANNIEWHYTFFGNKIPFFSFILNALSLRRKARSLHKEKSFQLVHCRSYISALIGLEFKRKESLKFLFDMRGFWADERVDGNLWSLKNPLYKIAYRFFKKREKAFFRESDYVVSLTNAAVREIEKWNLGIDIVSKTTVIPCCADFNLFRKPDATMIAEKKASLGIGPDTFVLMYLGAVGTWYMTEEMVDFYKVLLGKKKDSVFLILTAEKEEMILSLVRKKNIPEKNIKVFFVPKEEVAKVASIADLSLVFIKPAYSKIASSPTKLGELLALEVPVICNSYSIGDTDEIISYTGGGMLINEFSNASYHKAIDSLPAFLTGYDGSLIREKAKKYFDLTQGVGLYESIYKKSTSEIS